MNARAEDTSDEIKTQAIRGLEKLLRMTNPVAETFHINTKLTGKWAEIWIALLGRVRIRKASPIMRDGVLLAALISLSHDDEGRPIEVMLATKDQKGNIVEIVPVKKILSFETL